MFSTASRVDELLDYTAEMWEIVTSVIVAEWFGLRLPRSKVPWEGPVYLPDGCHLLYCLDRNEARLATSDIRRRYLSLDRGPQAMTIFAGYGLAVPDDLQREREGFAFLARQADYFRSLDDYLFVVQESA